MFMVAQPGDDNWCDGCGECSDEEMEKYPLEICEVCDKLVCSRCTHSNCGPLEHFDQETIFKGPPFETMVFGTVPSESNLIK